MNGLILVALGLLIAVLAVDGERPGFVNDVVDAMKERSGKDG